MRMGDTLVLVDGIVTKGNTGADPMLSDEMQLLFQSLNVCISAAAQLGVTHLETPE